MPKVLLSPAEQKRQEFRNKARASILKYMQLAQISEETLSQKQNVTVKTVQNRVKDPGKMQLQDLWEMAIIFKCPLGELCGGEMPEELIGKWIAEAVKREKQ